MSQRDSLADKIRELAEKNDEIENINSNLEKIVEMRTKTLEDQNKRISEYSFINAHNLRGPLASILGLINLITKETDAESRQKLNHHLLKSAEALDDVVRSINRMLEREFNDDMNIGQQRRETSHEEEPKV
jgi:light-regulated signal transduction histidine kinase (bacteriophytochrome)